MREVVPKMKAILQKERCGHSRVSRRGASGLVGSEHGLSRKIRKHIIPRHVWAGAVDMFLNLWLRRPEKTGKWTHLMKRLYGEK